MSRAANYLSPDPNRKQFHVPQRSAIIAMRLFVFSLGVLFFASMLAYAAIRTGFFGSARGKLEPGAVRQALPASLLVSTALVLLASFTISRAVSAVRRERQAAFRGWLAATLLLGGTFVLVQVPSLVSILSEQLRQWRAIRDAGGEPASGILAAVFFLIVLHAAHVVGGMISLAWTWYRAGQGVYDHENHVAVRNTALYWHFLDVVWMVMFTTLWALG